MSDSEFFCQYCGKTFHHKKPFQDHEKLCKVNSIVRCPICNKNFTQYQQYEHLASEDHIENLKKFNITIQEPLIPEDKSPNPDVATCTGPVVGSLAQSTNHTDKSNTNKLNLH